MSLSTGALQWCRLADEQPFAVIAASGTAYNGSYFIGVSSEDEVLPVEDTFFRGSFLRINVNATHFVAAVDLSSTQNCLAHPLPCHAYCCATKASYGNGISSVRC